MEEETKWPSGPGVDPRRDPWGGRARLFSAKEFFEEGRPSIGGRGNHGRSGSGKDGDGQPRKRHLEIERDWARADRERREQAGAAPTIPEAGPVEPNPPFHPQTAFQEAVAHYTAGRLDKAERLYHQLLRADPQYANALHLLGVIAFQRDNSEVAIGLISQAIEIIPTFPSYHCNLGNVYSKMGRLDEAVASFRTTIEFNPHYAEAYYNLANILKEQKKFDEAVEAYHRVIELQPSYAEAYYNLANITSDLGKFDDAITSYRQAV